MTIDEKLAMAERVPELERRLAQLEAANQTPPVDRVTVTVEHAAEKLDATVVDVRRWIKQGLLSGFRKGNARKWLVTWASVLALPDRLASGSSPARANLRPVPVDMETEVRRLVEGGHKERRRG